MTGRRVRLAEQLAQPPPAPHHRPQLRLEDQWVHRHHSDRSAAAVASTTGLAVRTTHLTGPTTDLGIQLGTALLATGGERRAALRGAVLRGGKVVAFMVGAGLAVPLSAAFGYLAVVARSPSS